ncbi:sensor histidine kinase [Membranihabitans maritimus]|uniref:sensor histidine kinase n=1 Tax=Membranihabitans maritimus TaxID=2904244 RepID=UPI001F2DAD7A|nr:histidine kinase [Membranihabitans maritimus]
MEGIIKKKLFKNAHIYSYAAQYSKPLHIVFWIVFFLALTIIDTNQLDSKTNIISNLTLTVFFAGIVYMNILYLIPKYLFNKKTFLYVVFLLTGIVLITPVYISLQILILRNYPSLANQYYFNFSTIILLELFVAIASLVYAIIIDWLKKRVEISELYTTNIETELNFLKTQINPHFLFNSLNSIYALTLKKSDEAPELVLKLSEIMRYMLYDCNEDLVPLEQEISYIRNYLELEKVRKGRLNEIVFNVEGDPDGKFIAPLLLITFVENSFKHGVNNVEEGYVHIDFKIDEKEVYFNIVNSVSPQIHIVKLKKNSGGIGLENAKRRLELLYPDKHHLKIKKSIDKFEVSLLLNI